MFLSGFIRRVSKRFKRHDLTRQHSNPMRSVQNKTDAEFFSLLDVKPVAELVASGQIEAAREVLLEHYKRRVTDKWLSLPTSLTDLRIDISDMTQEQLIEKANSILKGQLTHTGDTPLFKGNGEIDWTRNPTNNREWIFRLNRHQWWSVLGLAYKYTGEEKYAKQFVSQMLDWIESNPPLQYKNETSPTWRLMEAALRLRVSWIPAFSMFYNSPSFSDDAKITMLRGIYDHAKFLSLFKSKLNHLIREANGLACVGIYFPEFNEASSWRDIALNRLESELLRQVNRDGSQIEVSTGYQWLVIDEFEQTYDLLKNGSMGLPNEDLSDWLVKMYRVLVRLIRPDGSFPEINDGFILYTRDRLAHAGKKLGCKDLIYIGTGGKLGIAPKETSSAIRDAGIYVMRSDWTRNARYLLFDAGPYGGFHGHEDKLNIEISAYGQKFIVDSGSYTYEKTDPYRKYFVGSQGHNTVLVDGQSQIRRWAEKHMTPQVANERYATWVSTEEFDYVEAIYAEGYGAFELKRPKSPQIVEDVTHLRRILFVKPDYWLIIDELRGDKAHDYQLLYHCAPETTVTELEQQVMVLSAQQGSSSTLYIVPASTHDVNVSWVSGQESPIQGWYSVDHHRKTPSPTILYEAANCVSKTFVTLLYPFLNGKTTDTPSINTLNIGETDAMALVVEAEGRKDYFLFSEGRSTIQFGPYKSDALIAGIRTENSSIIKKRFEWRGEHELTKH